MAREYAIADTELNKKVADFEQVLRDPTSRSKAAGAGSCIQILMGPVQAELDQAKAETLVWSLDGVLRYVPMAALYDGKQYLVEKYNTVTITPASIAHPGGQAGCEPTLASQRWALRASMRMDCLLFRRLRANSTMW